MTNDAGKAGLHENLLGPFYDDEGRELIFLVCCDGEKVQCYVGPFQSEETIQNDLLHLCRDNAHFRTARLPRDAYLFGSHYYLSVREMDYARRWVDEWIKRQMDEEMSDHG